MNFPCLINYQPLSKDLLGRDFRYLQHDALAELIKHFLSWLQMRITVKVFNFLPRRHQRKHLTCQVLSRDKSSADLLSH